MVGLPAVLFLTWRAAAAAGPSGDDVSPAAVAFTCASCLMAGVASRPTCGRCLGGHWQCGYSAIEAKAAHASRSLATPHGIPT